MKRLTLLAACSILTVLVSAGVARAQWKLIDSALAGIKVPEGYDAEVFIPPGGPGEEAIQLAVESNGNILASSNFRIFPSFDSPVFRFSSRGKFLIQSSDIRDPDGICAIPRAGMRDLILVAGGRQITEVNSLDGGVDLPFATGFTNLNWIASDSQRNLYVSENTGEITQVDSSGNIVGDVYYGALQPWRPIAIGPPDQPVWKDQVFLLTKVGTELLLLQLDPASRPPPKDLIKEVTKWTDDESGSGIAFGPDGLIYVVVRKPGQLSDIVAVNATGGKDTFATGVIGTGVAFDTDGSLLLTDSTVHKRTIRIFPVLGEFGTGCPGDAGIPHLGADTGSLPFVNQTFKTVLTSLPQTNNMFVLGIVGFNKHSWAFGSLPQSVPGWPLCTLYVSPDITLGLPPNPGTINWDIPIPGTIPALQGCRFYLQCGILDSEPGHIFLSATNVLTGVIR